MNTTRKLTFIDTPGSLLVSLVVIVIVAGLGYYAWRRSGYSTSMGLLELLRIAIVAMVLVMLNQPEWIEEYRPDQKPTIAVLWDNSQSMQTQDVINGSRQDPISRAEAVAPLVDAKTWSSLDERLDVVVQPISEIDSDESQGIETTPSSRTNLNEPLQEIASRVNQLLGVVLISDGDWNEGGPPVEAASRFRVKNVPIFTVAAGSPTRLPDVELTSVEVPTTGAVGKPVRIPFTIDSSLPREFLTTVTLKTSEGETLTKDVKIAPMGRTYESMQWKTDVKGDYMLTLSIPQHADETIAGNNIRSAPIKVRQEQLQVLIIESYPRWEYRYLRNALSRDPGVEVSCLLFHPGLDKVGGGSTDYIQAFPEQISKFDVVFLGDVGLEDGQLTIEQCELLKGLVEKQASGLVFIPGWQGRQFSLLTTELSKLCPVILDASQPGGWGSRTPGQFELTERGRSSLLTKLADTQGENVQVWEELPGFQWYAPVVRATAGSEVLAVHSDMSNQYGRLPLLATRTYGFGKVLFMGTDGAWRWRKGVEDKYHYRFWGQVVRWMAYQRNMVKGETMRLFYTPDQPKVRQTLTFNAHVMDAAGEPIEQGDVIARVIAPSGKSETVRLLSQGDRWGVFLGRYTPAEAGKHKVTIACQQTSATLDDTFVVQGDAIEQIGKPARPDVLDELAMESRGKSVQPDQIDEVIQSLAALPMPPPSVRRMQLWSHPMMAALLIVLLGVFWVGRKASGLF